ncbi:Na+/H+ antiporter subunit E [Acidaminobacter hydrogenoformans]|uniref:Na+/H+ ion antiporter subunit n=1 Tax=Acidaminobacter hydrogenoformans DSM 2784 TaxID=1120920 RepID=A0A1G5RQC0_9FIRM|nr:Na+/H+ antiporter subunit E [Acidaminobacter hydrogenoformans]SCZ76303.1 Na+/H+ ion antiporter subunit [Acidaminobacter hydrogenoformans DSM 2784]
MAEKTNKVNKEIKANKGSADGDQRHQWVRILQLGAVLFFFWLLLTGRFGLRMTITGLLSVVATLLFYKRFLSYFNLEPVAAQGFFRILRFSFRVILDIFASALAHMKRVVYGSPSPEMFTVTLTVKEPMLVALIANAITLTPGSMTVEVHGSELTVLAFVDGEEEVQAFRRQIHTRYEQLLTGGGSDA